PVVTRDVVDQLEDHDRLADARTAEESGLAALRVRLEQVDHLDPGLEHLDLGRLVFVARRIPVDRPTLLRVDGAESVDRLADGRSGAARGSGAGRAQGRACALRWC